MNQKAFHNKTVWITGASSGIGRAVAVACYREGARIIVSSRDEAKLLSLRTQLLEERGSERGAILIRPLDMTDQGAVEAVTRELFDRVRQIDVLVLAAGVSQRSLGIETDIAVVRRIMETNFYGPVTLTKTALPFLLEGRGGRILVVSSAFGKFGAPARTAYAASKHALHGYFDSLRTELPPDRVAVTLIAPGAISTDIAKNALAGDGSQHGRRDEEIEGGMRPEDCARVIVRAIRRGRDEVNVGFGLKLRLALLLKFLFPRLLTKILRRRI